jgi:hypothetical protein
MIAGGFRLQAEGQRLSIEFPLNCRNPSGRRWLPLEGGSYTIDRS